MSKKEFSILVGLVLMVVCSLVAEGVSRAPQTSLKFDEYGDLRVLDADPVCKDAKAKHKNIPAQILKHAFAFKRIADRWYLHVDNW